MKCPKLSYIWPECEKYKSIWQVKSYDSSNKKNCSHTPERMLELWINLQAAIWKEVANLQMPLHLTYVWKIGIPYWPTLLELPSLYLFLPPLSVDNVNSFKTTYIFLPQNIMYKRAHQLQDAGVAFT